MIYPNSHEILSRFTWVRGVDSGDYARVQKYNATDATLTLSDRDDQNPEIWIELPGRTWGSVSDPGVTESEFKGATRCSTCGGLFETDDPKASYDGC